MTMTRYQLGSRGDPVRQLQQALQEHGLYLGPLDGDFGGGTQAAVRRFQAGAGLSPDGCVGGATWNALCGAASAMPPPPYTGLDLLRRCLTLTGAFETGAGLPDCFCGLGGDFDGQGISFGVLQWNFGQGTLQPLLAEMAERHNDLLSAIFGEHLEALSEALTATPDELMNFARSVQHPVNHQVFEPWRGYAKALGRAPEFQQIQAEHARALFERALRLCDDHGLWSERAAALMFDIVTQNGSIGGVTRAQIRGDLARLPTGLSRMDEETMRMEIIANRRAEAANPRWVDDVRSRKLCIARGGGTVHGIRYDLDLQFGIGLRPMEGRVA